MCLCRVYISVFEVIDQKRVRLFDGAIDRGIQHRETDESTRPYFYCFEVSGHDAQVFDMASKTIHASLVIRGYFKISHEIMYLKNNQNVRNLLLFVVSHVGVKIAESFAVKTGEEESKLLKESIPKSIAYKTKWAVTIFREWQMNRKV